MSNTSQSIAFVDTEIDPKTKAIVDIGCVKNDGSFFHQTSISAFVAFLKNSNFICGHNIFNHDIKYIANAIYDAGVDTSNIIDTLFLSPLLFPSNPYHALLKDDKLQSEDSNNPLNDSIKAKDLFYDEVASFHKTETVLKEIYYLLLRDTHQFQAFFRLIGFTTLQNDVGLLIKQKFHDEFCQNVDLRKMILEHPIALAYCLSLIDTFIKHKRVHSITPPWVLKNFPEFRLYEIKTDIYKELTSQFTVFSIPTTIIYFEKKEFKRYGRNMSIPLFLDEIKRPYELMCE